MILFRLEAQSNLVGPKLVVMTSSAHFNKPILKKYWFVILILTIFTNHGMVILTKQTGTLKVFH